MTSEQETTSPNGTKSKPDQRRLEGAIADIETELRTTPEAAQKLPWYMNAQGHLERAKDYLKEDNLHQGWAALQSAQRALLLDPSDPGRARRTAITLLHELNKLSERRANAIRDMICDERKELRKDLSPRDVYDAVALRDDQFQTDYFKIELRGGHLKSLFKLLLAAIGATLLASYFKILPPPFDNAGMIAGIILFGTLGAGLSVARGLLSTDLSAKIPAQQIGAFVIWMRPAIGAAAALISFVLFSAKVFKVFEWDEKNAVNIFTVAIAAGYCERFIVGAIESLTDRSQEAKAEKAKPKAKAASA